MWKKVVALMMGAVLVIGTVAGCGTKKQDPTPTPESGTETGSEAKDYSGKLFDQSYVHVIDIEISDADWADLKANPTQKTKYAVNVTIDGETIANVSFATKGNTSLSSVATNPDSDRYSFKLNFGKYEKDQTYYGLDKLNLNNIYADATYMKDYVSYEIFRAVGLDAPLTSYVELRINGESFGLYLAIEEVGESYLDRTDNEDSALYKPETEMLGNMDKVNQGGDTPNAGDLPSAGEGGSNFDGTGSQNGGQANGQPNVQPSGQPAGGAEGTNPPTSGEGGSQGMTPPDGTTGEIPNMGDFTGGDFNIGDIGGMMGFGGSNGADLSYKDDNEASYSDIFDNAVTDITDEDKAQVIAALKALSEGNAASALDITAVIKYFVAHNFVLNYDSYTGSMLHNYYLLETDGKLSVIPWDYNLAFGAFAAGNDATALVNTGIDSPLSGATADARPLWNFIVSNEEYLKQYHEIYQQLMDYMNSGKLTDEMQRVYEMIRSYVEKDNSAFFTVSEFETAYATLVSFCKLRAESITKQLSGSLSAVTSSQNAADKVDASSINISSMGSQGGGQEGGGMQFPGGNGQDFPGGNGQGFPGGDQQNPGGDAQGSDNQGSENQGSEGQGSNGQQ